MCGARDYLGTALLLEAEVCEARSIGEAFLEISASLAHERAEMEVVHPGGALVRSFVQIPASFLVSVLEGARA